MLAYALAENTQIHLVIIGADDTVRAPIDNPEELLEQLTRAIKARKQAEQDGAIMVKPQPKGVRIDGWDI